jgi:hypothetical protein
MQMQRMIPAEYCEFLLEHNGGYPEPCNFNIQCKDGSREEVSMEWFLAINI